MSTDNEWGRNAIVKMRLTQEQRSELYDRIIRLGINRKRTKGELNEADFACGAMGVMEALGIAPPMWPMAVLAGIPIFTEEEETS